jgi:hypothetical protein
MQKHANRSNSGFWGKQKHLSERLMNEAANQKIRQVLAKITWINIHTLSKTTCDEIILELRQAQGFGARWTCDLDFKGLIEP